MTARPENLVVTRLIAAATPGFVALTASAQQSALPTDIEKIEQAMDDMLHAAHDPDRYDDARFKDGTISELFEADHGCGVAVLVGNTALPPTLQALPPAHMGATCRTLWREIHWPISVTVATTPFPISRRGEAVCHHGRHVHQDLLFCDLNGSEGASNCRLRRTRKSWKERASWRLRSLYKRFSLNFMGLRGFSL